MPIYKYRNKKTGHEVEVIRSFEEYELPPQVDELPADISNNEADWERMLGVPLHISKWPSSTGPVKGRV